MIVSRKNRDIWYNLKSYTSRLSGPYWDRSYVVNNYWHRLYGRSVGYSWDINAKNFWIFKED